MKTYIIQLEEHDDLLSIQDKMSWGKTGRILLVWPRKGRVRLRRVDFLLLQRHAQHLGAQMAFVTKNILVKELARSLDILIFTDAVQAQQHTWRRLRRKALWRRPHIHSSAEALRLQQAGLLGRPAKRRWAAWLLFPVGVMAFLAVVLFFLPGAMIRISPRRTVQTVNLSVSASPDVLAPSASGRIPAHQIQVEVEGSRTVESTGRAVLATGFAVGQVRLTNLSDQVLNVSVGSVLRTAQAPVKRFSTVQSVRIPAGPGTQAFVAIQALLPGLEGNVPAGAIKALEGPAGPGLQVENLSATTGGKQRFSPAPTAQDYLLVKGKLLEDLQANAQMEAQAQLQTGQTLLADSLRSQSTQTENQQPRIGQPGDHLQLTMRVQYEAWYVLDADVRAVAQAALAANPLEGFQPVEASLRWQFIGQPTLKPVLAGAPETPELPKGKSANETGAVWDLRVEQTYEASWQNLRVIQSIQGQTVAQARRIIQHQLALSQPPDIVIYPAWWQRMPYLPARISLEKQ